MQNQESKPHATFYNRMCMYWFTPLLTLVNCIDDVDRESTYYLSKVKKVSSIAAYEDFSYDYIYDNEWRLLRAGNIGFFYNSEGRINKSTKYFLWDLYEDKCKSSEGTYSYDGSLTAVNFTIPNNIPKPSGCPTFDGPGVKYTYNLLNNRLAWLVSDVISYRKDSIIYTYQNDNIQQYKVYVKYKGGNYQYHSNTTIDYDNKRNPFQIYKSYLSGFPPIELFSKNNPTQITTLYNCHTEGCNLVIEYSYSYNKQGYPLTRSDGVAIYQYEYIFE